MEERKNLLEDYIQEDLINLFQAFSNPTRLNILYILKKQALTVTEVSERLGISQSATSHQLRRLKFARLVRDERQGRKVIYGLTDNHIHDIFDLAIEHVKEIHDYD